MSNNVFANGREVSCKSSSGNVTAAFPDVCLSPPSPPAGPVPLPYPLSSFASDTDGGSKTVKIGDKEVMLKDKSFFSKSTGDEAATKTLGQGVITHTLGGKVYFVSWSMDVEVEGENVVRHLDMTTSNHASPNGNQAAPWPEVAKQAFETGPCKGVDAKLKLRKYGSKCPGGQTPHHLIPDRCCTGMAGYSHSAAPCVCVKGKNQHTGSHKRCHAIFDPFELKCDGSKAKTKMSYARARNKAAESAGGAVTPPRKLSKKEQDCIKFQLDAYYKNDPNGPGLKSSDGLTTSGAPGKVIPPNVIPGS